MPKFRRTGQEAEEGALTQRLVGVMHPGIGLFG